MTAVEAERVPTVMLVRVTAPRAARVMMSSKHLR